MGISVQHNANGSITVTADGDALTIFPKDPPPPGAAASPSGGAPGPLPVIDPDDPLIGWPLPGAMSLIGKRAPSGARLKHLRMMVNPASGSLEMDAKAHSLIREYSAAGKSNEGVPVAIVSAIGQRFELGPVTEQLRFMQKQLNRPIVPYLSVAGRDEPVF